MFENEKIKAVRKQLNLTQQEVADKLGVSKQYLSKVENGMTELSKEKIVTFCNEYKISFEWMFGTASQMFRQEEDYVSRILYSDQDQKNFQIILDAYGIYIEGIKDFIEKKHPDATFSNKLKTARKIFYNRFYNRKVSFNTKDIKKYLDYQLSESKIQKEILDIYYEICKQENK